jgi:hypothetical protein
MRCPIRKRTPVSALAPPSRFKPHPRPLAIGELHPRHLPQCQFFASAPGVFLVGSGV